jgi:hypothetical protein
VTGNNINISILTPNANDLSAPIKRHRIANWVKKTRPNHMLLTRDSFHKKKRKKERNHWLTVKG